MKVGRPRTQWWAAGLACLGAWSILASPWLAGPLTIPYDAKAHFQAQLQFLATALHTGQSPFWTPNVFGGSPQVADPQSLIFSPALLLAYLSVQPSFTMLDGYVLVLLALGGLAILLFFRDRGWHPVGGIVAALAFAFGASAAWRIQHVGQIQSYALFATTLWMLARMLGRRRLAWAAGAGLSAGLMIAEPDQVALLSCYVLAAYTVWHLLASSVVRAEIKAVWPALATAGLCCLMVAAVPLGLTYLFVEETSRAAIPLAEAGRGSLHPASLLTAFVGDLYGALDPKIDYWGPYSVRWNPNELTLSQNMSQIYFGILPSVLVVSLGWVRGLAWDREIRVFTIALVAMLLYAVGTYTPVYAIAYRTVPGVDLFRRPADATFLLGALAAITGGYLCHRLASQTVPAATAARRWAEILAIAGVLAASLAIAAAAGHLGEAVKPLLTSVSILAVSLAVLWFVARYGGRYALTSIAVVTVFMTWDLGMNNGPNESTALSATQYEILRPNCTNETVRYLKSRLRQPPNSARRDRVELVGLGFAWPNLGLVHGFDHVLGYNPLRLDVTEKAVGAGDTIAGWDQRRFTPLFSSYRSLLADMLGLRFIATPIPVEQIDPKLKPGDLILAARTADAYVYENPRAMPRVMFVGNWMHADFARLIETGAWPAFDPNTTLLLEDEPAWGNEAASPADAVRALGTAGIAHFENTMLDIDVAAPTAGFVLINSVWHPWWRATVDGQEARLLKANVMFHAVPVPAGRHRIHLAFEPLEGALMQIARLGRPTERPKRPAPLLP